MYPRRWPSNRIVSKCRVLETRVAFLDHVVDNGGISTDPDKIKNIVNYPRPENLKDLRTFLGMSGYYRKFLLRYAQTAKPLHELTSSKVKFLWKSERENIRDAQGTPDESSDSCTAEKGQGRH
ncbi:hypothetical protein Y032_0197g1576 [Ancylostoma ceylanicum]|nr:hypothetical protein Y032_0197g1576 [Ancylostoma ceylanicum]